MNLPNRDKACVERGKVADYLLALDHPEGAGKATFFVHFGFTREAWEILAEALLAHGCTHPVAETSQTRFGTKYEIDGTILCPNSRSPRIRTV